MDATTTAPMQHRRRQVLVDRAYQLGEVNRGINYFLWLIFLQLGLFGLVALAMNRGLLSEGTAPVAVVAVSFTVPILLCIVFSWLTIRSTHRVAGAAYRLSQDARNIIMDPSFRFHLRKGDYLQDLADELNQVMEVLEPRQRAMDEAAEELASLRERLGEVLNFVPPSHAADLRGHLERVDQRLQTMRFHGSSTTATGSTESLS